MSQGDGIGGVVQSLLPLAVMYGLRQVDAEDPVVVMQTRLVGGAIMAVVILVHAIVYWRVVRANDDSCIRVNEGDLQPSNPLEGLIGGTTEQEQTVEMTIREYDMTHLKKDVQQMVVQTIIISGMHLKWGYLAPIIISPLMSLVGMLRKQLFSIHIVGNPPDGLLKRPWKKVQAKGIMSSFEELKKSMEEIKNGPEDRKPRSNKRDINRRRVQAKAK